MQLGAGNLDTQRVALMTEQPIKRSRKRIIRREELPAAKLSTTKAPPKPPAQKKPPKPPAQKKPAVSPSDTRLHNLDAHLNDYSEVWREYRPLVIGVEKEVFRHIAEHHLSASKRVVQRLLRRHVQDDRYQRHLLETGMVRYHLNGGKVEL